MKESSRHVTFSDEDLVAIGVGPGALYPFVIQNEHAGSLVGNAMGHSALERRPLVRFKGHTTVALPTAIGVAIRRFAIEQAAAAGDLWLFQSTCHLAQFSEAFLLGRPGWGVGYIEMPEPDPDDGMREFIGTFDKSGYVHLVFVPDDFEAAAEAGLASIRPLEEAVCKRIRERASALASRQDYRRGLTVLVHGGVGRRFSPTLEDLPNFPPGWQRLCVSASDFMLLGSMPNFTALRAWKLAPAGRGTEGKGHFPSEPARVPQPGCLRILGWLRARAGEHERGDALSAQRLPATDAPRSANRP